MKLLKMSKIIINDFILMKAALAMMGKIKQVYRLPLCEPTEANLAKIRACLEGLGLL